MATGSSGRHTKQRPVWVRGSFIEQYKDGRTGRNFSNSMENLTIVSRFINPLVAITALFFPRRLNRRLSGPSKAADSSAQ